MYFKSLIDVYNFCDCSKLRERTTELRQKIAEENTVYCKPEPASSEK